MILIKPSRSNDNNDTLCNDNHIPTRKLTPTTKELLLIFTFAMQNVVSVQCAAIGISWLVVSSATASECIRM